ncbi:MAG: hypothetical protein HUK08_01155 [Bacteroidaceae bacterium]|nr:hypothetical protein [Bacteroidaceae bacterium]
MICCPYFQVNRLFAVILILAVSLIAFGQKSKKTHKTNDDRVYLQHADNLRFDQYGMQAGAQIAKGNVKFLHKGSILLCDSAYFYQQSETFKAFGHVKMKQGDTLTLTSDYAWYDGGVGREMLYASKNVVLTHNKTVLHTDSLVYDKLYNFAYYLNNGKVNDKGMELTSEWGEYHLDTKLATFVFNVKLKDKDYNVVTDTLIYDAHTSKAHCKGPSTIVSGQTTIQTNDGYFDNKTNWAQIYGPSTIISKSSTITTEKGEFNTKTEEAILHSRSKVVDNDRTIIADTLISNDETGINEGYGNVIYTDGRNKNTLFCGEFIYNKKEGHGYATARPFDGDKLPLLKDYSQKDTLYVHGDTIRIETFDIDTDSMYRKVHVYPHVRIYRKDVQAVADSVCGNSQDSVMIMYKDPIVWHANQQLVGEEIHIYIADSTIDRTHVIGQAFSIEALKRNAEEMKNSKAIDHYNQISSSEMWSYFEKGKVKMSEAISNVLVDYYPFDEQDSTLMGMVYCETDTLRMYMTEGQLDHLWTCANKGTMYPLNQIPADRHKLPNFALFDYIRPIDENDLFEWRPKKAGTGIKNLKRSAPPKLKL